MNNKRQTFVCNDCCIKKKTSWPPIKAITQPIVPLPPVIVPSGEIIPTINRYFYIATSNINLTNGATIPANLFWNDNSDTVIEFNIYNPNGYANLYINAVLQEGGMYTVTSDSLTITPNVATIYAGTPIIIESVGFSYN
ncbi:DUF4183 domain-containing protein [Psychrobacillus sp. NPDC096389]|uniref:DUF4183 domain-containing protein n=1 Tax=Psychrobacillus sp. NPDC096389 TaxID=3364490 RepID=UPI0037FF5E6D